MTENRLKNEKSPYLLQHSDNPVDWYPWCAEAFEKAEKEDKPVFLSIGYSTCHWCHVMAHESFEDEEVAGLMNDAFVSIKVDREERPDIDGIYMTVCQMLTGSGGWPLTVIMTPDKRPFFAGTYFPKRERFGRPGMIEMIPQLKEAWKNRREEIMKSSDEISSAVARSSDYKAGGYPGEEILDKAFKDFEARYDEEKGGFGSAPKFPTPHNLSFLLRYWKKTGDIAALNMVTHTLTEMRKGGIYDHIGFGFHRYSTDREWLVPHFEKMLYDQALIAVAYTETWQATGENLFKQTAEEILQYVMRDMTSAGGGFYSAEDADSEGEEGKFYLWDEPELRKVSGEYADLISDVFNCAADGNWVDPSIGGAPGTNILHTKKTLEEIADAAGLSADEIRNRIEDTRKKLFEEREKRIHPHKDDKILTDWNGLMISAFARAASAFGNKEYEAAAVKAADFVLEKLRDNEGNLLHRFRLGEAGISANIDDYAFLAAGLLDLYEAGFNVRYLEEAIRLQDRLEELCFDEVNGGFYFTGHGNEKLLTRRKEIYDGAVPSGNSIALLNLLRLARFTGNTHYEEVADKTIKAFSTAVNKAPVAFSQFLAGLSFAFGPSKEIVVVEKKGDTNCEKILNLIGRKFLPNKVVILLDEENRRIKDIAKYAAGHKTLNDKSTVYVCENFNCKMPVTDPDEIEGLLE